MVQPEALNSSIIKPRVGFIQVSAFPGIIGFDFARQLSKIVQQFQEEKCDRLIVDLRANCGGGLGSLRLMSLFISGKVPIGYSLSRGARDSRIDPQRLPIVDQIPHTKPGLYLMALRFLVFHRERSLRLITEGIGALPFQERVIILADESSRGGSEMVAAFAKERGVAKIVGSRTPGETLGAANFRIGESYRLRIPLVGWYTASNQLLERKGVAPDDEVIPSLEGLRSGRDEVLNRALELAA
jgi:C-terminal processing protease CtpA/Prc